MADYNETPRKTAREIIQEDIATRGNYDRGRLDAEPIAETVSQSSNGSTPFEALTSNVGWNDNVLNGLQQPTYHVRFFITEDSPINYSSFSTYDKLYNHVLGLKQTTVAESGVTAANITSLSITTIAGPNPTYRSMAATEISFTVREPLSVGFMDILAESAKELGVKNFAKTYYFIEVSFLGYSDSGGFSNNPCGHFPNKGRWLYQIGIKDIDVDVDHSGGTYVVTAVPYEQRILSDDHLHLPDGINPEATTISGMLTELSKALNKSVMDMYGYQLREYEFVIHPLKVNDQVHDISQYTVMPTDTPEFNSRRSNSLERTGAGVKAHFARGTAINDVVDLVFANSQEAQKLVKDVITTDSLKLADKKVRECVIFKIQPVVSIVEYDFATEDYIVKYTLHVLPYYTQRPILEPNQISASKSPDVQAANALKLRKNGYLAKRYDYLFTGLNTEVISLDMKFNLKWAAALPRVMGFRNSLEASAVHDKKNPMEEVESKKTELLEIHEALGRVKAEINTEQTELSRLTNRGQLSKSEQERRDELTASINSRQQVISQYSDYQERVKSDANKARAAVQAEGLSRISAVGANRSKVKYAEEVREEQQKGNSPTNMPPVSIRQSSEDTRFLTSGAFPDYFHRDRSIYGAVLDQVYGPLTSQLQNIHLEVRGDPYWLGMGNMERTYSISALDLKTPTELNAAPDDINRADYSRGDILFLLTYKYPRNVGDGGAPEIKNNDFFTGVYATKKVVHRFESGQFTQSIEAFRMPLIDVFKAFGYRDDDMIKNQKEHDEAKRQAEIKAAEKSKQDKNR